MKILKTYLIIFIAALLLVSCGKKEKTYSKAKVEMTGDLFNSLEVTNKARLFMTPNPANKSSWMICASVPMQKIDNKSIRVMHAGINLLDKNGTKVDPGFMLIAEDMKSVTPVLNSNTFVEKTIVFSTPYGLRKDFSHMEAARLIKKTKQLGLILSTTKISMPTPSNGGAVTLEDLLQQYDIYAKLQLYDSYLRRGESRKAKQLEDQMWTIEKQVQKDPSIPKSVRDAFENYIETREDQIEDKY
jgi:hypothetical protein